jgi:hypothetical protein
MENPAFLQKYFYENSIGLLMRVKSFLKRIGSGIMSYQQTNGSTPKKPSFIRMIEFVRNFTRISQKRYRLYPIVVGGLSVAIYTRNEYTTFDVDLVYPNYNFASRIFDDMGFIKEGRHWYSEELEIAVEIPDDVLAGDMKKIVKLNLSDKKDDYIFVIGIEDLLIDRINALAHWRSKEDGEWAERIYQAYKTKIDKDYLLAQAKKNRIKDIIKYLLQNDNLQIYLQ